LFTWRNTQHTFIPTIHLPAARRFRLHHKQTLNTHKYFFTITIVHPCHAQQPRVLHSVLFVWPRARCLRRPLGQRKVSKRKASKQAANRHSYESSSQDKNGRENQDPTCKSLQSGHRRICTDEEKKYKCETIGLRPFAWARTYQTLSQRGRRGRANTCWKQPALAGAPPTLCAPACSS
ncbi:unnamed protein product, partial [Ectocarpus sp. 12 AP-2014]